MRLRTFLIFPLVALAGVMFSCEDDTDEDVGSTIQPQGDLLHSFSNMISVGSGSLLVDSVLSNADYLFLGQYTDSRFGVTRCEVLTQIDSRVDGVRLPDTTVSSSSSQYGVDNSLLSQIDSLYGDIISISNPENLVIDSASFFLGYEDDIMGDSTALQAINIYELTSDLPSQNQSFTNADPTRFCDKEVLLGSLAYQVQGHRETQSSSSVRLLRVPLSNEFAQRLGAAYDGSITTQKEFNQLFKGFYIAHSFNEGAILKVSSAGVFLSYHYDALIHTTYNGVDTVVSTKDLPVNPLSLTLSISANKSVSRINVISHGDWSNLKNLASSSDFTYVFAPSGLYTSVDVPFSDLEDSVKAIGTDFSKVSFNSVRLKLFSSTIDWTTKLSKTPSKYMLLIERDSVVNFFYTHKSPDGLHSFAAVYDSTTSSYAFDLSRAAQVRLEKKDTALLDNLVVLPVYMTSNNSVYYYNQQLWPTALRFYGNNASDKLVRPRLDAVFTIRE